jgi:hypothetical protein
MNNSLKKVHVNPENPEILSKVPSVSLGLLLARSKSKLCRRLRV